MVELWHYLLKTKKPIWLYGMGDGADKIINLLEKFDIHGMVHITGGGFYENVPRILPENCDAEVNAESWEVPVVFKKLQEWGNVPWKEMYRTFNMGVGMVLVIDAAEADAVREHLRAAGEEFILWCANGNLIPILCNHFLHKLAENSR